MKQVNILVMALEITLFSFFSSEPSSPINLTINYFDSTTLLLSWLKPVPPNGIITEYFINCSSDVNSKYYTNHTTDTTGLISGLQPFTNYTCSVTAYTKVGGGPPMMPVRGQTDQSTKLMYNSNKCLLVFSFCQFQRKYKIHLFKK